MARVWLKIDKKSISANIRFVFEDSHSDVGDCAVTFKAVLPLVLIVMAFDLVSFCSE